MTVTLGELSRRIDRMQPLAEQVPVLTALLQEIRDDVSELRSEQRSLRRALYSAAISVAGGSVLFFIGVTQWFGG